MNEWKRDRYPVLRMHDMQRLFLQLLDQSGYHIEYRTVEEEVGPRSFTTTEYRLVKEYSE